MARTIRALVPLILLVVAMPAFPGDTGKRAGAPGHRTLAKGKTGYTLGEVKILGSAETPGVLFFLPRAKFRLLPYRMETDWKKKIRMDDKTVTGE